MSYPGNPSLGDEVKQRITATYEQSVQLAERGRQQEAILGCDFILELDPQFAPARALKDRLSGGTGEGATPPGADPAPGSPGVGPPGEEPLELGSLDTFDLPDAPPPPQPSGGGASATAPAGLAATLRERLQARDFQGVVEEAGRHREAVQADPELASVVETAQSRLEAQPYVENFLKEAGLLLRADEPERARGILRKVRSLDPEHPLLGDLEAKLAPSPAPGDPQPEAPPGPTLEPDLDLDLGQAGAAVPPAEQATTPSSGSGGDDRIAELLDEGQQAADRGELQEAIDAWSRIFLIDVDHEEAARRIEDARRLKAERERAVEEVFHEGLTALEEGDRDTARQRFERVLEMQPNHLAARDYLQQIETGGPVNVAPPRASPDETAAIGELGSFDLSGLDSREGEEPANLQQEILVPPPPGGDAAEGKEASSGALPSYGKPAVGRRPGVRSFVVIGGLVLVLVLAAGWFVYTNKERFFPNSDVEEPAADETGGQEAGPGPIERAEALHERGQTAMALGLLRRIRPDHPRHEEAQELMAQWEAPDEESEGAGEEEEEALAPEVAGRRERMVQAARTAFDSREYLLASELYQGAEEIASLAEEDAERLETAQEELEPLAQEVDLFRQGEYEIVLPRLWRLHEEQPENRDVRRMLVTSYYNRGVRQLQRGDATTAATEFEEALSLASDDRTLQRLYVFAQTYERRPRDLLYRIYVKHLPVR
ncbi:MAG: tetratricopeptide repeat protein [Thermoanaerobaculia bacterium]